MTRVSGTAAGCGQGGLIRISERCPIGISFGIPADVGLIWNYQEGIPSRFTVLSKIIGRGLWVATLLTDGGVAAGIARRRITNIAVIVHSRVIAIAGDMVGVRTPWL